MYRKTPDGQTEGVAFPKIGGGVDLMSEGENAQQDAAQLVFLQSLRDGVRPIPSSLQFADGFRNRLLCQVVEPLEDKASKCPIPSVSDIERTYPHHAVMVHLSRLAVHPKNSPDCHRDSLENGETEILDFDISDLSAAKSA